MKGILLAGGTGSRLWPITKGTSKQLLPVFDKPMIFYPLATLMEAGIRDILIVCLPDDIPRFEALLGDGTQLGLRIAYASQERPEGIAQSFLIGESFIDGGSVCLILGDNLFHGDFLPAVFRRCTQVEEGGIIFGYWVAEPERYGVVAFDSRRKVVQIEEKPQRPQSHYAVPGLYFYDSRVVEIAKSLKPSARGELEITDVNMAYLEAGTLQVELLGRGCTWLDTGTHEALSQASAYVQAIQERQGLQIGCLEEIAFRLGYIDAAQLAQLAAEMADNPYGQYLKRLLENPGHELEELVPGVGGSRRGPQNDHARRRRAQLADRRVEAGVSLDSV